MKRKTNFCYCSRNPFFVKASCIWDDIFARIDLIFIIKIFDVTEI